MPGPASAEEGGVFDRPRPLVVGHRGLPSREPANTIASIEAARAAGADVIEVDVRATRDGVLVLHHDASLGRKRVRKLTFDEARARARNAGFELATLEQALDAVGEVPLDVELKTTEHTGRVVDRLAAHEAPERLLVTAFRTDPLATVHEAAPELDTGLLLSPVRAMRLLYRRKRAQILQQRVEALPVDALIPHKSFLTLRLLGPLRATGCEILVWTVNRDRRLRRLVAHPLVDGVITDRAARAIHLRRELKGPTGLDPASG